MIIAASLKRLLKKYKIPYRVLQHQRTVNIQTAASLLHLDLSQVLLVQVMADHQGVVLVVYPVGCKIDYAQCQKLLHRNLQPLPEIEANRIFIDSEAGAWPAIGQPYNLEVILDKSLKQLPQVYFASGSHTALIQMQTTDYLILNPRAKFVNVTVKDTDTTSSIQTQIVNQQAYAELNFSQLPCAASQILQHTKDKLQTSGIQTAKDMQAVVEHILSFTMVSHVAPSQRNQDIEEFWRHAFYAATYAQKITELIAEALDPAISYMAGLFHNFGLLLFSQMFSPEYTLLKKWLALNPNDSIAVLERRLLGMGQAFHVLQGGHAELGEWLLRSWQMPEAICVITKEHHSTNYNGQYGQYVKILQLTNQLLRAEGIGDGLVGEIASDLLVDLDLTLHQVQACIAQIQTTAASLDDMVRSFTHIA